MNKENYIKLSGIICLILSVLIFCFTVWQNKEKIYSDILGHLYSPAIINIEAPKKFINDITVLTDIENDDTNSPNKFVLNSNFTKTTENSNVIFSTGELNSKANYSKFIKDLHLLVKKDKYNEFINSCKFVYISIGNKNFYLTPDRLKNNIIENSDSEYVNINLKNSITSSGHKSILALNWVGIPKAAAIIFLSVFSNFFQYTVSWIFLFLGILLLNRDKKFELKNYEYLIIGLILLTNLLIRLSFLPDTLITADDEYSVDITENSEIITRLFEDPGNPPLYFILLKLWRSIFGQSITTAFILSVLTGVITIWTIYNITKKHFGSVYGLVSAGIASVSAYMLFYGKTIRVYGLAMLFTVLYLDAFVDLLTNSNKKNILKYTLITIIYINLHYYCILITALSFIFGLIYLLNKHENIKNFTGVNFLCAITLLPYTLHTAIKYTIQEYFNSWIPDTTPSVMMDYLYGFFGDIPLTYVSIFLVCLTVFVLCKNKQRLAEITTENQRIIWAYCAYLLISIPIAVFIISQIKPIAIFRYFSVYYPLLIIFTVTLPLCLPQIPYKKAFVTLFLICFTSAQTGNTYLANEDLVTYNIQALLMNTENPALVKYRREKRYKHLKLHTDHAFFFGDAADKGINEGETIYFAVRPCDYLHKLEILGTKFNLQRIETSNKCYYLFRLQRREAL